MSCSVCHAIPCCVVSCLCCVLYVYCLFCVVLSVTPYCVVLSCWRLPALCWFSAGCLLSVWVFIVGQEFCCAATTAAAGPHTILCAEATHTNSHTIQASMLCAPHDNMHISHTHILIVQASTLCSTHGNIHRGHTHIHLTLKYIHCVPHRKNLSFGRTPSQRPAMPSPTPTMKGERTNQAHSNLLCIWVTCSQSSGKTPFLRPALLNSIPTLIYVYICMYV